ncbi:RagB/SusD family nutrient uptake outer membrane protein [Belliella marina]|uniref:RagB/SusD family nutrient uptake outer membrane protein n=1 Tax=Belliella marina TaxID=1644146 RepID=A0ABW4VM70_9BACT
MKKLIYLLGIAGIMTACVDYLEETSITDITSDLVYKNPEGLKNAVVALYDIQRDYYSDEDAGLSTIRGTDINWSRSAHDMGAARYDQGMSPNNGVARFNWRLNYRIIERANSIIEAAESIDMLDAERARIIAEAKVFRARSYFFLIRWFDNIILNTEPTRAIVTEFSPAQSNAVWGLIREDLSYAIEHLDYQTSQPGRITKGLAMHMLADVALWIEDWGLAEHLSTTLISEGPYRLLDDVASIFDGNSLNHEEAILVIQFGEGVVGGGGNGHRWAQYFTSQYYNVRGVVLDHNQGGRAWARTHPNDYLLGLYEEGDKRIDTYYRRYYFFNDPGTLPAGKNLGDTVTVADIANPYPNIMPSVTKYWDNERDINSAYSYKNIIAHRLAETYFIAAEALMRQGKATEGLVYINAVRDRAGLLDPLNELNEEILLEERAKELAFEGHRWFALKRMGVLVDRVRKYGGNEDGGFTHPRDNIRDYHVRRPIPQGELDLMPGYPQNDGYQ